MPSAGSMRPSQSAISRWGWGFRAVRGNTLPGDHLLGPLVVGVVYVHEVLLDLEVGLYPTQAPQDFDLGPRSSSPRALGL